MVSFLRQNQPLTSEVNHTDYSLQCHVLQEHLGSRHPCWCYFDTNSRAMHCLRNTNNSPNYWPILQSPQILIWPSIRRMCRNKPVPQRPRSNLPKSPNNLVPDTTSSKKGPKYSVFLLSKKHTLYWLHYWPVERPRDVKILHFPWWGPCKIHLFILRKCIYFNMSKYTLKCLH